MQVVTHLKKLRSKMNPQNIMSENLGPERMPRVVEHIPGMLKNFYFYFFI